MPSPAAPVTNDSTSGKPVLTGNQWARAAAFATACYYLLAALMLAWGAYRRFQIPQTPIIDPDINGYLVPALSQFAGKGFVHIFGRSFPYPAFVWLNLRLFADFRAIPISQHFLGVAAGGVILLAWNALLRLAPPGGIPDQLSRYIGFGPAAIYLGSATAIAFEHEIRPEAIFPFFTILNLYVSFLFIDARYLRRHSRAIWLGGLNAFIAFLIYLLKPSFGFASLFSTAPVWLSLILPGAALRQKGALLAVAILPAAVLLFLPEQMLKRTDAGGRLFLPETLFTIHASLILDQLSNDLALNAATPYPRAVLQAARDLLQKDLPLAAAVTTKTYPSLGFNPDYLMYDSFCNEFENLPETRQWSIPYLAGFYDFYYRRAAIRQPSAMLHKVLKQLRVFYCSKLTVYRVGHFLHTSDKYANSANLLAKGIPYARQYAPVAAYSQQCATLSHQGGGIQEVNRILGWTRFLAAHYLDALLAALVSPLLLFFRRFRRHLLWIVAGLWLAYSYNFGNCLTIAIIHSLDVERYVRIQLIYTVFSQFLSLFFIMETIVFGVRVYVAGRRERRVDQPLAS